MLTAAFLRKQAFLCSLFLVACVLLSRPFVEMGVNDDWSYIWSAKILAQSNHFSYVGWDTPMLGWQLWLGALFIKLFGFSFSVVRASVLLVSAVTAALLQRTFVRAGLLESNATLATLCILVSPLYLPLAFSFMSDAAGLFSIVLCLYACLRAMQAESDRGRWAWFVFAASSSVLTGTVRQIAWLGMLVLVPSTWWALRRRLTPLPAAAACLLGVTGVFGLLHWFSRQPYVQPEGPFDFYPDRIALRNCIAGFAHAALGLSFLLLPILVAFLPRLPRFSGKAALSLALVFLGASGAVLLNAHSLAGADWLAPFNGNYMTDRGVLGGLAILGTPPVVVSASVRAWLTLVTFAATLALVGWLVSPRFALRPSPDNSQGAISMRSLAVLLIPFSLAYCGLLISRGAENSLYDRYLLPLMVVAAIFIVRYYQRCVAPGLGLASTLCVAVFALYGVCGLHDLFAGERARLVAVADLHAAGVADSTFYGGFEYDGWTQLTLAGYVNSHRIVRPTNAFHEPSPFIAAHPCGYLFAHLYPVINPRYALSFSPSGCDGAAPFQPVRYATWLPPFHAAIYVNAIHNLTLER